MMASFDLRVPPVHSIELITLLALLQYLVFGALVGQARARYQVHAPAVTGHPMFERAYRVQMNTLELLVVFVPSLWLAARFWSPAWMAAVGALWLVGRALYAVAYAQDPARRALGFGLSLASVSALLGLAGVGWLLQLLR
jgi:glutathione S-transferase